jgi:hypothetical protein
VAKRELSEFEKARAKKLGQEFTDKFAQYFSNPSPAARDELRALKKALEKMGFRVGLKVGVDVATKGLIVNVNLWIPKEASEETEPPQE